MQPGCPVFSTDEALTEGSMVPQCTSYLAFSVAMITNTLTDTSFERKDLAYLPQSTTEGSQGRHSGQELKRNHGRTLLTAPHGLLGLLS